MSRLAESSRMTSVGTMALLVPSIDKAADIGPEQCAAFLNASGEVRGEIRMTGAGSLGRASARSMAMTAASPGRAGTRIPETVRTGFGLATGGHVIDHPGGLPIRVTGGLVGGIGGGLGSGPDSNEEDHAVAIAAVSAVGATA